MRVSDLLNEVSAAQEFTVGGKKFKARVNPNTAPTKDKPGTWDLVLVNSQDDLSISVPEFFSYEPAKNNKWHLTAVNNYTAGQDDPRDAQAKPFPGATLEKEAIDRFCKALDGKKASAKRVTDLEDQDNVLGLNESAIYEMRKPPRGSVAILPAAKAVFDKTKVSVEDVKDHWKDGTLLVISQGPKKSFLYTSAGVNESLKKGAEFQAHHDQTGRDLGYWTVDEVINVAKSDNKDKYGLYVFK